MSGPAPSTLDRIRCHLVGLKMPRALEGLEHTLRQLERGEVSPLEAIDALLGEELSLREGRRVKAALKMGRLLDVKTLAGFDFAFQPSLDKGRILALAQLDFVDRHEVVHFLGQPGCGKTHLALALGVEAVKAGRSVYFATLADLVGSLAKAEREGALRERLRFLCRPQLLVVDEIGYLPVSPGGGVHAPVGQLVEPLPELGVEVAGGAGEEEVLAHVAERPLHLALGLRPVRLAGAWLHPVMAAQL